jgi:hypothetical protein
VGNRKNTVVPARVGRQLFLGGCALVALAVLYHVATSIMLANAAPDQSAVPSWLQKLRGVARSGVLPFAAIAGLAAAAFLVRRTSVRVAIATCTILLAAIMLPIAAREWTRPTYTGETFQAFAGWRAQIPVGTEVLWFDSPVATWLLLQRPSYLSNMQEASGLFSRPAAMEMKARLDRLAVFLESEPSVGWREKVNAPARTAVQPASLAELCTGTDVKFVVTSKNVSASPVATTPPEVSNRYNGVQLYRCPSGEG